MLLMMDLFDADKLLTSGWSTQSAGPTVTQPVADALLLAGAVCCGTWPGLVIKIRSAGGILNWRALWWWNAMPSSPSAVFVRQ